jgi:hypothetical protein
MMTRARLTWVIVGGVGAVRVAGAVDAVRSSEPKARPAMEWSAARETTFPVVTTEGLPRCTTRHLRVSIEVLGGTATIVVRHVWGGACHLARTPIRLLVSDRLGRRVGLEADGSESESVVEGDFSPDFERLIDIAYLQNCHQRGPFTEFVLFGPHSTQRKLPGSAVGCFRGG